MGNVVAAAIAFVGTHFLLSHPLRRSPIAPRRPRRCCGRRETLYGRWRAR